MARKKQLLHFAIQGANIFGKFLLMLGLAHFLNLSELGLYATTIAAFGILQPLLNLQFDRYTYRYCASATPQEVVGYMRHYMVLLAIMLCVAAPAMGIYVSSNMDAQHIFWVVALFVSNVIAMEISRLLMVRQYSTRYMIAVFISQSLWIYLLLALWLFALRPPLLLDVWRFWAVSSCLSLGFSLFAVRGYPWVRTAWRFQRTWLIDGLKLSPINLTVLVCGLGVLNSSIFFVEHMYGLEEAGIYGFFFSIVLAIRQWVMGGAYVMQEPKLFKAFDAGDEVGFRREARIMFRDSLLAYIVASVVAIPAIYLVMEVAGKTIPIDALPLYWGFILTACAVLMSDLGQVIGFARHLWHRLALLNAITLAIHMIGCLTLLTTLHFYYAFLPLLLSSSVRMVLYKIFLAAPKRLQP